MFRRVEVLALLLLSCFCALVLNAMANANSSSIGVTIELNYGSPITYDEYVVIGLEVHDKSLSTQDLKVEFSYDGVDWYGFIDGNWRKNTLGVFQSYYPDFKVGGGDGVKTVLVRVYAPNGKTGSSSTKITFSSDRNEPVLQLPKTVSHGDNWIEGRDGPKHGSGSLARPYLVRNRNVKLILDGQNISEYSFSLDGVTWSNWKTVNSNRIEDFIEIPNTQNSKVMVRGRNSFGVESSTVSVHYMIDNTPPFVDVRTSFNDIIAYDGRIEFELAFMDNTAGYVDFKLEIALPNGDFVERRRASLPITDRVTIVPISMDGLPSGIFNAWAHATDLAGNTSIKAFKIYSYSSLIDISDNVVEQASFSDMPNNWARKPLENAVKNGLLFGSGGFIMPNDPLTRAQMATVMNRVFSSRSKALLDGYLDVLKTSWYYDEIATAVSLGFIKGSNNMLYPERHITREEAFVIVSRAFMLEGDMAPTILDIEQVSPWAIDGVKAVVSLGYATTQNGYIRPKDSMTRAELALLLDSIVKHYIKERGTYLSLPAGNIVIASSGVTLRNLTIHGDLIISDSVGRNGVILNNVKVLGRLIIRTNVSSPVVFEGNNQINKTLQLH